MVTTPNLIAQWICRRGFADKMAVTGNKVYAWLWLWQCVGAINFQAESGYVNGVFPEKNNKSTDSCWVFRR